MSSRFYLLSGQLRGYCEPFPGDELTDPGTLASVRVCRLRLRCILHGQTQNFKGAAPLLLQLRPRPAEGASVCLSKEPLPAGLLPTWQGGGFEAKACPAPPGRHARPSAKTLPGLPPEAPIRSVGSLGNFWAL
jgi:hypothetical protein